MNCGAIARRILLAAVAILSTAGAGGYEFTAGQQAKLRAFLEKYPEADENRDGVLTPSEIWLVRTRASRARGRRGEAFKDADVLIRAIYTPAPIDESKSYGPVPGRKIRLFILSGQSNMVGQGLSAELPDEMLRPNDRLLMFEDGKWQPLRPLKPTFGPEIAFARTIAKAWPDETIGIVKQAWGGTGVLAWHPNWSKEKADLTGDGRKGNLWEELTGKVRQARQAAACEVMGFIWQQGAKDMQKVEAGRQYLANLKALVEGLRHQTGVAGLPLVLGSHRSKGVPDDLSGFDPASYMEQGLGNRPGAALVLKAQFDAQVEIAPAKMVPLRDLPRHPENVHANTEGQLTLGRLLAEGYLELAASQAAAGGAGLRP